MLSSLITMVVNPFGEVINELAERKGYFMLDIDIFDVERARTKIPILKNRVELK